MGSDHILNSKVIDGFQNQNIKFEILYFASKRYLNSSSEINEVTKQDDVNHGPLDIELLWEQTFDYRGPGKTIPGTGTRAKNITQSR